MKGQTRMKLSPLSK